MQDIYYVLKSSAIAGGVKVVLDHVYHLNKRGYNAKLFYIYDDYKNWYNKEIPAFRFPNSDKLIETLKTLNGIKVATWCETAPWVHKALNPGDKGYYLVQDIEESYFPQQSQKDMVLDTYRLGLKSICDAVWVKDQLISRFGQDPILASIGLDFDIFRPMNNGFKDPTRVLAQCRLLNDPMGLKGWYTTKSTIEQAFEKNRSLSIITFGIEGKQNLRADLPHIHIQFPNDRTLNEQYNEASVFLFTSNHEGFGLPAAQAMMTKLPVVATYCEGNEEFCINHKTALMAEKGDINALAMHVNTLINNKDFARELANQAYDFIQQYTWNRVIDRLEKEYFGKESKPEVIQSDLKLLGSNASDDLEYPLIDTTNFYSDCARATLIIPCYNHTIDLTTNCIKSARKTTNKEDLHITVVDDGTRNPDVLLQLDNLVKEFDCKLILNNQSLGYSASINNALQSSPAGDYFIISNNDIEFIDGWLDSFLEAAESHPKVGVVGAKLLYFDNTIQHAGMIKFPNSLQVEHLGRRMPRYHPEFNKDKYCWSITGALFLLKRSFVEQLGGMSIAYGMCYEDVDICYRAWQHGWRVLYAHKVEAYHGEGLTRGLTEQQKRAKSTLWTEREILGQMYYNKKWSSLASFKELTDWVGKLN